MNKVKTARPLRVGFDLDGVILYNPARVIRPIVVFFKRLFLKKEKNQFHYPKTPFQKFIWHLLHKSSFISADGVDDVKRLVREGKIEAYIVSARYDFLKKDFARWIQKIGASDFCKDCFYNNSDEQPYVFKEKMIKKLSLDIFVEDNWDVVKYLAVSNSIKSRHVKIYWICNILDWRIPYLYKFSNLKKAVAALKSNGK